MQDFIITKAAEKERLCDAAGRLGLVQLPLFRAAADGLIDLIRIEDTTSVWPARLIERSQRRPMCFMIGGDPGHGLPDPAPAAWSCGKRLKYWCRAAIVHGAGGELEHYRNAVVATVAARRLAFVETTSARAREWAEFLNCPQTLVILPQHGPHPVPDQPPVMQ